MIINPGTIKLKRPPQLKLSRASRYAFAVSVPALGLEYSSIRAFSIPIFRRFSAGGCINSLHRCNQPLLQYFIGSFLRNAYKSWRFRLSILIGVFFCVWIFYICLYVVCWVIRFAYARLYSLNNSWNLWPKRIIHSCGKLINYESRFCL